MARRIELHVAHLVVDAAAAGGLAREALQAQLQAALAQALASGAAPAGPGLPAQITAAVLPRVQPALAAAAPLPGATP